MEMDNRRRFLRLDVEDFLEIRPLNELARYAEGKSFNLSLLGICFFSQIKWDKGQVLLIDYFLPQELDSVKMKVVVIWCEFVSDKDGFLHGAEIIDIEQDKEIKFIHYYFRKLKERLSGRSE